ncbi:MAG TPA: hypothetical protein VNW97_12380 [Candidatus Saccharimonadales bacterium]|jgi:hypothetical protein|nr:hypothetical protein [Candidatus Saccharimonadales bacterium]
MGKPKRKLSARERAAKKKRNREFMTIFINGKQKRVRREPTIDGISVGEFIMQNADPIWLHQNEMWEYMQEQPNESQETFLRGSRDAENDIPF